MRQALDGKNFFSAALHFSMAILSSPSGQSLRSGLPPTLMAVLGPVKMRSSAGTPSVPTRERTAVLLSSAASLLKLPQCPSWSGCAGMIILRLMYEPSRSSLQRLTSIKTPRGRCKCTTWSAFPARLFCIIVPMPLYSMLMAGSLLRQVEPRASNPCWMVAPSHVMKSTPTTILWPPRKGPPIPTCFVTESPLVMRVGWYLPWIQTVLLLTIQYSPGV
mmetsp:Transcript_84490/g.266714  ORF Transcript_84490/g.266714 Transcript_84490/m.266714 type:complete len:218 (+) Transcript_84490:154-807(+)